MLVITSLCVQMYAWALRMSNIKQISNVSNASTHSYCDVACRLLVCSACDKYCGFVDEYNVIIMIMNAVCYKCDVVTLQPRITDYRPHPG